MVRKRSEDYQKVPKFGVRHVMTILLFTFSICMYLTRSTLSLAIVAMTDSAASTNPDIPTYDWSNTNVILAAFFWTYIILQPFAGYIVIRLGLKWVLLITMLINCIAFILIPLATFHFGSTGLITCRLIQGLCHGFFYPTIVTAIGMWVPIDERSLLSMIIGSGESVGFTIAMLATGYISASWWGWPAVFYILGTSSIVWCIFWWIFATNSPATHPKISEAERYYIEKSLETEEQQESQPVPFKAILTSLPFWTIVVANMGFSWGYTIIETEVPTYLHSVLNFDITSNGAATASPKLVQLIISIPYAPLGDYLVRRNYVTLWTWRRFSQCLGTLIPSLALIWLAYISKEERTLALVLLNVLIGTNVILSFGSLINHVDLSPRYAGVMISIENTISQGVSMFAPIFIQHFVTDSSNIELWRSVFLSLSAIMIVTATIFVIFGAADIQPWNSKKSLRLSVEANLACEEKLSKRSQH